jgi:hypothetical protein
LSGPKLIYDCSVHQEEEEEEEEEEMHSRMLHKQNYVAWINSFTATSKLFLARTCKGKSENKVPYFIATK